MEDKGKLIINEYPVKIARYANGLSGKTYRVLRLALLERYKNCWWCNKPIKDYLLKEGEHHPHNMATIDHLYSRRTRAKGEIVPKVLACYECNWQRSRKQQKGLLP